MDHTKENERLKLYANFCNIVGGGFIITGGLNAILLLFYSKLFAGTDPALVGAGSLICVFIGASIHLGGHSVLGGLK